jgi:nucleoside-diphosphate kinase
VELTLFIVKPHAVERGLVGTFLERFEKMGLKVAAIRSVSEPPAFWEKFYPSEETWFRNAGSKTAEDYARKGISPVDHLGTDDPIKIGKLVKQWLVSHMSSSLSVAVVFSGNEAVTKVRLACGKTLPNIAAPGTIRFDYSTDSPRLANEEKRPVYNLVHSSDPEEERDGVAAAKYEINLLFPGQFKSQ